MRIGPGRRPPGMAGAAVFIAVFISAILYIQVCSECDRLTKMTQRLTAQPLTLASLRRIYDGGVRLELDEALTAPLRQAQQAIDAIVAGGQVVDRKSTRLNSSH